MTTRRAWLAGAGAGLVAMPAIARAQGHHWRCVTSWSRDMPGPGVTARRLVERIGVMSRGELSIQLFAAGEIVPAFAVLDAVSAGTVEMGHSAALFWGGKLKAAPLFTTAPFGLGPTEHVAWLRNGGQELWDELYGTLGVKPFLAGNTGPSSAGWFRNPIGSLTDLKGLRIRATGLGGEVYARLGALPLATAPADTYVALERGTLDAAEFLAPANDAAMGLQRIARHLAWPGFNKPNGASELLVSAKLWADLPAHLKAIVEAACQAEHDLALAEAEHANAIALASLLRSGVQLMGLPDDVLSAARTAAMAALDEVGRSDANSARIVASYREASAMGRAWRQVRNVSQYRL